MDGDRIDLPLDIDTVKGFLDPEEGAALYHAVRAVSVPGHAVEIGSYCGKSSVYLGCGCRDGGRVLFCVDHHCGSEEHQPGWDYHDAALWDAAAGRLDTLPVFRETLRLAKLEDWVVPVVGRSEIVGRAWAMPIAFLFLDGGHAMATAVRDYRLWAPWVRPGGILAIHDVFPDPADGGRPPFEIYRRALASDLFEEVGAIGSLRLLKRLGVD